MSDFCIEKAVLLPDPSPQLRGNSVLPITSFFRETAPGRYEAVLSETTFTKWEESSHWFLRLSRVGCRAMLCVTDAEGKSASRSHYGSFTDWQLELTKLLKAPAFPLTVSLELEADEVTLSPYQQAGILGDVTLLQVPSVYFSDFYVRSIHADGSWSFAIECSPAGDLPQQVSTDSAASSSLSIEVQVETICGELAASQVFPLSSALNGALTVTVPDARLWSPEDPYLYRIVLLLKIGGKTMERCEKTAGLCKIEKSGQQVLFNGKPLKLRGLAYREPLAREGFDPADDLQLFVDANVNYLRSLYYPFSERFLQLCDEAGVLVEQSAPVNCVGQSAPMDGTGFPRPATQNAPALRPLFLEQYQDMLIRDRSHPSVLLWCLGNDSVWGDQFRLELEITRALDPDRLANFHLPMTIPQDEWVPDVWSMQHGAWNLDSDVCYDQMVIFHTQGADNAIGYAVGMAQDYRLPVLHDAYALVPTYDLDSLEKEDGIHEFWGESLSRFWDNIRNTPGALGGAIMAAVDEDGSFHPSLERYHYGILDCSHQPKPEYWHVKMAYSEDPLTVDKQEDSWTIRNSRICCQLSTKTGLLTGVSLNGKPIICEGPFLHTGRFRLGPWKLTALDAEQADKAVCLTIRGDYGTDCSVSFFLQICESGQIHTTCRLESVNRPMPHTVKSGIGLDPGGLDEFGIRFLLPSDMDTLQWTRTGLWPQYPADHIGRPRGIADRENRSDFTSLKANVLDASVSSPDHAIRLLPVSGQSLRLAFTADPRCVLDDREDANTLANVSWDGDWYLVDDAAGLANSTETMAHDENASCTIRFNGTGLTIFGTTDRIRGCCDVWMDGRLVASGISQHTPAVQFPAMCRGYEKRYHTVLYQTDSLPLGEHVCQIVVTGTKEPMSQETWISIDSFEILHPDYPSRISMYVNMDYNYPRLTQGNYMRPAVMKKAGDEAVCSLFLEECGQSEKGGSCS
ncbi:MAG: hypothetical protein IJ468_00800 [Lachnospiraceae bacterium]|nr:hypothetical protein [Lachnospiraceae bacterium]